MEMNIKDGKVDLLELAEALRSEKIEMFATYPTWKDLQDYADRFSGSEKAIAHLFIGLALNTALASLADGVEKAAKEEAA